MRKGGHLTPPAAGGASAPVVTARLRSIAYDRVSMSTPAPDPLASPCVRNCCLDDANICMGCGRSLQEVIAWGTATDATKAAILALSRERLKARERR
jgi:predicted Fe-S protein YdhL (DUF1289 family)